MPTKEPIWKKYMSFFKDAVFIIGIVVSTFGWIRSETIKKTNLENEVKILTTAVEGQTKQLEKINDYLLKQSELNGKIINYIELNK